MSHSDKPLHIGFLTSTDPLNRRSWSGVHYSMFRAAERNLGTVEALGPVPMVWPLRIGDNLNRRLIKPLTGKRYHYAANQLIARRYSQIFERRIGQHHFDLLLAPASFTEIAYLNTKVPIVYCEDSTLGQLIDFYPGMSGMLDISKRELNAIEKKVLNKADLICYSSVWAAQSAINDYGADPAKVVVIPFGANYPKPPTAQEISLRVPSDVCRLFFLGGEWGRKGGDIAYETLVKLTDMGVKAELTVVGCQPPDAQRYTHPGFRTIPFLNMGNEADLQQLDRLFRTADFFLLPSRAECAAIAFCDANSFGVPVITTDVGGISSFIKEGENGVMLPLSATGKDFAQVISDLFKDTERYTQMRKRARIRYEDILNWDSWARSLKDELKKRSII
ncbi:glycosyltransferase family 4 protein [Hymenobacter sp. BT507]|uniref:Glycosyltransferase family 4 protein n=1 Tax=Hymenobacter citatus TaxID=2763506 RepID=A0ABR7ML31_9BACT|nr:glycosyltransferase family 4 protein [Hymenobacter citatus]MBC6611658.1 glycosyltransferase family 4 protein [Hymenobacter citatus]